MPFTVNRRFQGLYTGLLAAHLKGDELERGGLALQRATPNIRRFTVTGSATQGQTGKSLPPMQWKLQINHCNGHTNISL